MATDGRRCSSGDSYSRAAMVKVMAMLPPTMMRHREPEQHEDPQEQAMHEPT